MKQKEASLHNLEVFGRVAGSEAHFKLKDLVYLAALAL